MRTARKRIPIFIVSDSTGTTAEMVINAALVQFRDLKPVFKKFSFIKTVPQIEAILKQVRQIRGGILIYSVVLPQLRTRLRKEARAMEIYFIDLLGPLIDRIGKQWAVNPAREPGLLRRAGESVRVAEAIDFTLGHDDGRGVETLGRADLIILGVSRTSKTPTSLYLSCNHGLKVANVPIITGMMPPEKVFTLKSQKIGLTIEAGRLAFLRRSRWKQELPDYAGVSYIEKELDYCEKLFRQIEGIHVIDVSYSSIEEVAARIVELREERKARAA